MFKNWKFLCGILFLLAVAMYFIALKNTRGVGDGGLLSKKPCAAPCFFGIVPDVTDEEQVRKIIDETHVLIGPCKEYDFTSSGGSKGYSCVNANVAIERTRVVGVSFLLSDTIELQDVIRKYGQPTHFLVFEENLPDDPIQVGVRIFYATSCMEIYTQIKDGNTYTLEAETQIARAVYLGKEVCQKTQDLTEAQTWQGYGVYPLSP